MAFRLLSKIMKNPKLPVDKAVRASIYYHINEDGTISQVINHILPTGLKKQIPIFATQHSKVLATEKGLQAQFHFDRQNLTIDEIVEAMYSESDDIMGWLQTEASNALTKAEETFAKQQRNQTRKEVRLG